APRGLEAAHQLDHDLHGRVVEDARSVVHEGQSREVEAFAGPHGVGVRYRLQAEPAARALLHLWAMRLEDLDHAAADRTEAQEADRDRVDGGTGRAARRAVSERRAS